MRILIIGLNYAPEPVGIGPYTAGLAQGLARRGHDVEVVAGKPYYPQWQPYPGHEGGAQTTRENGVTVTRVPHYIPAEPSGLKRMAHHASFAVSAWRHARKAAASRPDLVFTVAPSLVSTPVAAMAARKAKAPLWLHIQDFEVEAAMATGLVGKGSPAIRAAAATERKALADAALVSTISPQMRARLSDKGVADDRIYELRNWSMADVDFASADACEYRARWNLGSRKIALYSGNIANKQGLEIVIEAARKLRGRDDLAFVICGEGPNRARLEALAEGLDNIRFDDLQPRERMADFLSLAHVHLLPQIVGAADLVLPSKLTNMLASGRPVIATAAPDTGLFDEVEGCGLNTAPGDADALAKAIAILADDDALARGFGKAAAQRAQERWSYEAIMDAMETRARTLTAKP